MNYLLSGFRALEYGGFIDRWTANTATPTGSTTGNEGDWQSSAAPKGRAYPAGE